MNTSDTTRLELYQMKFLDIPENKELGTIARTVVCRIRVNLEFEYPYPT